MNRLIEIVLRERVMVMALAAALLVGGAFALKYLNIEAYPDPSPPLIEIIAQQPGWSAEEMERQITIPLETHLNGMPQLDHLRSISLFGLTDIRCYFAYGADYYFSRQEVLNRLQLTALPAGVQPTLSPESAIGEIYRYELRGDGYSLMDLKTTQDWVLERKFKQVPGVIDVVGFGGHTKQFHVELDPNKLILFGVSVPQVMQAIAGSNANVGANYLELGEQSYNVRGIGLFRNTEDIGNVEVAESNGTPVYVKQLGEVSIGAKQPLGRVGRDYNPDIVQGVVLMRKGEKSRPTLEGVHKKVEELNNGALPKEMKIVPYYDRSDLIRITTHTVIDTLIKGMVLVTFILLAFLGHLRAALVVALSIPLSLMFTFIVMVIRGDSANLISMCAIDFGIIVDASVVMIENIVRHLGEASLPGANVKHTVAAAAREVVKPIIFSTAVIVAAFLPLFTMTGVEGKIQSRIKSRVQLPAGHRYEIAGEFQELQGALGRLAITVPVSIVIILLLLYMMFRNLGDAALLLGAMPFALVGGVAALLITGTTFSISSAVGFVSLFGVSVLGGVILISRFKQLRDEGAPLREAVQRGSDLQLRPVLMAALAAAIGLLPASIATGIGSETQRPLARVVVGGMISSAAVILLVLPAVYLLTHQWLERRRPEAEPDHPADEDVAAEN